MQVADPLTLYRQPENIFVAGFIGSPPMNLLKGKVQKLDGGLSICRGCPDGCTDCSLARQARDLWRRSMLDKPIIFGIRPEHLSDQVSDPAHVPVTASVIDIAEPMGSESIVYLQGRDRQLDRAGSPANIVYHPGEQLTVQLNMEKVHLFDSPN